jgi:hypothetical protein
MWTTAAARMGILLAVIQTAAATQNAPAEAAARSPQLPEQSSVQEVSRGPARTLWSESAHV